jgi:hypothetical protein
VTAATGNITTIAGTGVGASTGNGVAANTAQLNTPRNICLDGAGNIYIVEDNVHTVRKITVATGIINTIAGTGTSGYNGDGIVATTAMINSPGAVVADASGNVYLADQYNYSVRYICNGNVLAGHGTTASAPLGDLSTKVDLSDRCSQLGAIQPSGSNPFNGVTNATVSIDTAVARYRGAPYVQRHYDINPQSATPTQTATLTLYFTQAEFNAYNTAVGTSFPKLPTAVSDTAGIANVRITQYHGTGTAPGNYSGWTGTGAASVLIDPADTAIVWNSSNNRWEITFSITGFSGFYLHTANIAAPLPIRIQDFTAALQQNHKVQLRWMMNTPDEVSSYVIERSNDGKSFAPIHTTMAVASQMTYQDQDEFPLSGMNYYRIRLEALNGTHAYSDVRKVWTDNGSVTNVYPNPVKDYFILETSSPALLQTTAVLMNIDGRIIKRIDIHTAQEKIDISGFPNGVYLLRMADGRTLRIVK